MRRERLERELRQASQAAQKAAEDKARFLAILSHELRTPLQAVVGASHLLSARGRPGERADEIETLDAASKSLLTLIDGVLSYSRLESGVVTPTLHSFVLTECVDEALRVSRAALPRPAVALVVDIDCSVPTVLHTDQGMLRQVLINLVGNALKFTASGEVRVQVRADPAERAGDPLRLNFSVTDTGSGIDISTQQRLFQPFQQGGSKSGEPPVGSGLGLVICSMLVRALGGEIAMASEPGKGTQTTFSIMAQTPLPSATAPLATASVQPLAMRSLHVMVVEDNDVNRELLSIMLEQLGHRVLAVADGEAAIQACREQRFEVVLMDLNLPRIGGIEATRRILLENTQRVAHPTIIALTASVSDADRALCAAAGMRGFLTKPATVFSIDTALRGAVSELISRAPEPLTPSELLDEITLNSLAVLEKRAPQPFLHRLVERFVAGLPAHVAQIQDHWAAGARTETQAAAHGMAGASLAVGAIALAGVARQVSEQPNDTAVASINAIAAATAAELTSWLSRNVPTEGGVAS